METKDLNSIGLAYLQMVEKRNTEAKKNHAKTLDKVDPEELEGDHEDRDDKDIDNDGDVDSSDEYLHKKRKAVKKAIKKDDDEQEKFKAYTGDDKNDQEGTKVSEDKEDKFEPHMMYDPKTGKGYKAEKEEDHLRMKKMGYTHDKPEEIDELNKKTLGDYINKASDDRATNALEVGKTGELNLKGAKRRQGIRRATARLTKEEIDEAMTMVSRKPHPEGGHIVTLKDKNDKKVVRHLHNGKVKTISKESVEIDEATDLQEGAARQAALAKGLMDYCKEIGKNHMDHKDFMDHAKHVKAGNWKKAKAHADDQDTEVREKIHSLAIDHLGQGAASELYGGDRKLSKNKGDGKLHASYNESVNVDDVLALIDQGYTLDQAEAMVAEASCGTVNASRKQPKAGDNDRNMANNQRSIPAKGADTAPVRPGTKQDQLNFDIATKLAKPKHKVSLKPMPAALAKKMKTDEELHGDQHKLDHDGDRKITRRDLEKVRKDGAVRKESVMDRVSNMVEGIRADSANNASHYAGEAVQNVNELDKKTLGSYVKKAVPDMDTQRRFATEYEKRGMAAKNPGVMDKNFKKSNLADKKVLNRRKGINTAIDKMTKESVQEAAKPTAIHHSTPVTAAQANDAEAEGRAGDTVARRGANMTEKEFIDIHKVPETVDPAFDGNVAAKDTAENIKKAPKVSPTPNKNPTAGDKNKVKSTEAPAANTAVVGESYMDKYAKYIRGEI